MSTVLKPEALDAGWLSHGRRAIAEAPVGLKPLDVFGVALSVGFIELGPCERVSVPKSSCDVFRRRAERWGRSIGVNIAIAGFDFLAACMYCGVPMTTKRNGNHAIGLTYSSEYGA